jgi:putative copper resistance protein D
MNLKEELLAELSHTPMAAAGCGRRVAAMAEMRLSPPRNVLVRRVWPVCFTLIGVSVS